MTVAGIDEVGRGSWAGPLVAGAIVLPDDNVMPHGVAWQLADSKTLTALQRSTADTAIRGIAVGLGIGWVSSTELDEIGMTAAVALAMRRALSATNMNPDRIIIDGSYNFLPDVAHTQAIIKADGTVPAVSAASIVAKVARDTWMAREAAIIYPGYGFEKHVGYGTALHRLALQKYGPCSIHRRSFKPIQALISR